MKQYMEMMGKTVKDKITGFQGIVECVSFDLYGCVQIAVRSKANDKGESDGKWFDHKRLEVINHTLVMPMPDFSLASQDAVVRPKTLGRENGPAQKPSNRF